VGYMIIVLRALVFLMWAPAAVFAATVAATGVDNSPLTVPAALVVATALFSTLMGATTLAIRLVQELRDHPDKPLVKPWLYCLAHMLGSWSAGALFFVVSMGNGAGVWTLLGAVMAGSFGGAKACEWAAERILPTTLPRGSTP
jgi:hypothetical protein